MSKLKPKLYFRVALLALLLPLTSGDCNDLDLGMESGSIPDSKITASSVQSASTPAKNGRLNFTSGSSWCAGTNDSNPYLQIDLQTLHIICAVSTQGNSQAEEWVKNYTLQSSIDGSNWTDYKEIGQVKSLKGNEDRNSEVKHILNAGVLVRYLRFLPGTHHGGVCLRAEVFGVKQKPENLALGKPTNQSSTYSDAQIGAAESGRAVDGNADTDMLNKHCSRTKQDNPSWWRVDLAVGHAAVYEVHIVNRFTGDPGKNNVDYKITFGNFIHVASNHECTGRYSFIQFRASAICFTNPLTTGKYVGIMTTKSQVLQLCEVEIYSRENLAFGKHADQKNGAAHGGLASRGVDGNSETNYGKGSCTHTPLAVRPWWRVDLGQIEPVSEVYIVNRGDGGLGKRLNNFEIRVGSETSGGGVNNPTCGSGSRSVPGGEGKSFFCRPPLYGRYVTIRSLRNGTLTLCEVEVYSERRACQIQALGVSSKDAFPDNSFSATSNSGSNNVASKGRLNGVGSWSPSSNNNSSDYLQINLQYEFFICAVATQGKSTEDHWTTKYKLRLSLNNIDWVTYKENSTDKVFDGNSGRNDIVKHNLKEIARARFIRFQPTSYSTHKALRVEVFGVLKPAAPSQAPSSFVVSPLSSTSVRASWQLPPVGSRHGTIAGFKLCFQRKNSAADYPTVLTIQSNATLSRDITGLRKYSEYEFQVLAFSSVGNGPKSSVQEVRTNEDAPSKAPDGFTVTAETSTSIAASWELPPAQDRNGIIRGFKLFYKKNGSSGLQTIEPINSESIRNKVVTGLDVYTEYEFQVLAYTSVGDGPKSSKQYARTKEEAPSAAPSGFTVTVKSSTTITASWQLPPANTWNGIIKGFKLFYKKKDSSGSQTMKLINDKAIHTTDVSRLSKFTKYEFQVLAFTSAGDGPNSTVKSETTKEDAPSIPTSLTYSVQDQDKSHGPRINLTWSIPAKPNGVIRSYTVFYCYNGNSQKEISGIDALSYSVDVLGGATYQFHVRAVTIKPGPNATLTVAVPEYVPSHGPENVSSTEVNSTTFEVTWAALPERVAHGVIKMYQVRLVLKENCTSAQSELYSRFNTTSTSMVVSGLSICARYEVSIRGYTVVGPGPYSRPIVLQTSGMRWSKERPSSPSFPLNSTEAGLTAKITLPRFPANAKFFQVIVIMVSSHYSGVVYSPESFTPQDLVTYDEAHESLVPAAYVTFQFSGNDFDNYQEFIVGSGAQSNSKTRSKRSCDNNEQYYNKPLQPNTNYRVFLRAFVTEVLYISSNFVEIKTKEKPAVKKLPEKSILLVGELVLLTCEVTGDPEPSVTWTKNGNSSIPRAQFKNGGRILVIKDVLPVDSGVYQCKASNKFGESRTSTAVIVAVPPTIAREVSPSSVICEMQTLCTLSCHATSGSPFNYSWTKNGQVPGSDDIKIMNNIIVLTPRDAEDYGMYVCHATNSFGSTAYKITLSEGHKSSSSAFSYGKSVFYATVITLSCIVFISLVVNGVLIRRLRRALPENRATTADKSIADNGCQSVSPRDQHMSEPSSYMELRPRPLEGQSPGPPEFKSLQGKDEDTEYYNVGFNEGKDGQEEIYLEIGNASC